MENSNQPQDTKERKAYSRAFNEHEGKYSEKEEAGLAAVKAHRFLLKQTLAEKAASEMPVAEPGVLSPEHAKEMKKKISEWLEAKDPESGKIHQRMLRDMLNENFGAGENLSEGEFSAFLNDLRTPNMINQTMSPTLDNWVQRQEEKGDIAFPKTVKEFLEDVKGEIGLN